MKRYLNSLFFALSCIGVLSGIGLVACGAPKESLDATLPTIGRYVPDGDRGVQMGWPGSGLDFVLPEGGTASATIIDDGRGFMDLTINGVTEVVDLQAGEQVIPLVRRAAPGTHVRLTRRSESYDTGYFTVANLEVTRSIARPNYQGRILFIGDSITAGFGVAGHTADCQNRPSLHAPLDSYAILTADQLEAEPHLIAISGRGVVHNWDHNPAPVMPMQTDFALPDEEGGVWDHDRFIPDVIVIALGTNDWSVIDPGFERFVNGYRDMLSELRARFSEAHIVTVSGPLLSDEKSVFARRGIRRAMTLMQDPNISTIDLTLAETGLVYSCNFHPGRDSMAKMADELAAHVAARTNLSVSTSPYRP